MSVKLFFAALKSSLPRDARTSIALPPWTAHSAAVRAGSGSRSERSITPRQHVELLDRQEKLILETVGFPQVLSSCEKSWADKSAGAASLVIFCNYLL